MTVDVSASRANKSSARRDDTESMDVHPVDASLMIETGSGGTLPRDMASESLAQSSVSYA
jgi:hypothetical protein